MNQNLLDAFSPAILACAFSTAGEKSLGGIFEKKEENKENFRRRGEGVLPLFFSVFFKLMWFLQIFFDRLLFFLVKLKSEALQLLNT